MVSAAVEFDPSVHLCFQAPESRITMKELALEDVGISKIGVSAPVSEYESNFRCKSDTSSNSLKLTFDWLI